MIRKRKQQAACVAAGLFFLLFHAVSPVLSAAEDDTGRTISGMPEETVLAYLFLTGCVLAVVLWSGKIKNQKLAGVSALLSLACMPTVSFFVFETVCGNFQTIMQNKAGIIGLNLLIWYLIYAVVFACTNHVRATVLFVNTASYLLAVANAFVVSFREQPIMVMDIRSLVTAASVAGEYEYTLTAEMLLMGLLVLFCDLWICKMDFSFSGWKQRGSYAVITACFVWVGIAGMLNGDLFEKAGSAGLDFFRFNLTYQTDGYMVCTMKSVRYLRVEEPEGYSVETVQKLAQEAQNSQETQKPAEAQTLQGTRNSKNLQDTEAQLPENVIVIMNESFADLSVLGTFETSEPVLPHFYSISGNIRRGSVYVSVYGGGTANTEFEFLTGNSVAYLPAGTVAYQMYVTPGASSIVSAMKENGYRTVAFHPYRKDNYNRENVYQIYGFDEYYGKDDVKIKKLRKYASDASDYKNIRKIYEEKTPGEKLFLFNVTMQNHGGYDSQKYQSTISLSDCPGAYPQAEQYLSLIHESDQALADLIDYFSQAEEKTVILLFGDHQPKLEDDFYRMVTGVPEEAYTIGDVQKKYQTPYLLWANYEIRAETRDVISSNYLGGYLLDAIGIPLSGYQQYLKNLSQTIPAVNAFGYLADDGQMHGLQEEGAYTDQIQSYRIFQYNNLFDRRHRLTDVYE